MIFTGIEHIAIAARDPERLADWYSAVFGFQCQTVFDNGPGKPKTCMLRAQRGLLVEIFPAEPDSRGQELRPNAQSGLAHLAVAVQNFDDAVRHLEECQVPPEGAERAAPQGARVQFYRDPEGNLIHILHRPQALE